MNTAFNQPVAGEKMRILFFRIGAIGDVLLATPAVNSALPNFLNHTVSKTKYLFPRKIISSNTFIFL